MSELKLADPPQTDKTIGQYLEAARLCEAVFNKKNKDYGTAWRILRTTSLTDQIFIKAQRIRTIEEKGGSKVAEGVEIEFIGIVNYSVMALIQLEYGAELELDLPWGRVEKFYNKQMDIAYDLMEAKDHDYGEAWRDMRISSMTDLILMKILRIKKIENNDGETIVSEGVDANYLDMINYGLFALIRIREEREGR